MLTVTCSKDGTFLPGRVWPPALSQQAQVTVSHSANAPQSQQTVMGRLEQVAAHSEDILHPASQQLATLA